MPEHELTPEDTRRLRGLFLTLRAVVISMGAIMGNEAGALETKEDHRRRLNRERQAKFQARRANAPLTLPNALPNATPNAFRNARISSSNRINNLELPRILGENLEPGSAREGKTNASANASANASPNAPITLPNAVNGLRGCVPGTRLTVGLWEEMQGWLDECTVFRGSKRLRNPLFWDAETTATPDVDHETEVKKAQAWILANPSKAPKSDFARFLHSWFARAQEHVDG